MPCTRPFWVDVPTVSSIFPGSDRLLPPAFWHSTATYAVHWFPGARDLAAEWLLKPERMAIFLEQPLWYKLGASHVT